MLEGFYGIYQVGGIMVPLNIRLKPSDYQFILNHSESKVLFVDQELYHLIEPIKSNLETIKTIIVHGKDSETSEIGYDEWLSTFDASPFDRVELDENDECSLLYTSGTTGNPKGVLLTHRNNYITCSKFYAFLTCNRSRCIFTRSSNVPCKWLGFTVLLYGEWGNTRNIKKSCTDQIFEAIEKYKVTVIHMAPTVLNSLLQYYDEHKPTNYT